MMLFYTTVQFNTQFNTAQYPGQHGTYNVMFFGGSGCNIKGLYDSIESGSSGDDDPEAWDVTLI